MNAKKLFKVVLCPLFLFFGIPFSLALADQTALCDTCFEKVQNRYLFELRITERHFALYRWSEEQLRYLYYEPLWKTRTAQLDPLSKTRRRKGRRDEDSVLESIRYYEKLASFHANSIQKLLQQLQKPEAYLICSEQNAYRRCIQSRFQYFYDRISTMKGLFDKIFEDERVYRNEIQMAAGNRLGLYPEDSLESPYLHDDFYSRFEMERESNRFVEDQKMRQLFLYLHRTLNERMNRTSCCYAGTRESLSA